MNTVSKLKLEHKLYVDWNETKMTHEAGDFGVIFRSMNTKLTKIVQFNLAFKSII